MPHRTRALILLAVATLPAAAHATVTDLTTGTIDATLSKAIARSNPGDVLALQPGSYVEDFPDITHTLTIESLGGLARLSNPRALPPNTRAVLNVPGDLNVSLTLSGLEIFGANNDSTGRSNGAGILFETGNGALSVSNSWIHDNQDGILTGGADAASTSGMTVFVTHSEIDHNGTSASNPRFGFDHNIYAGTLTSLTVSDSYLHDALGGHEIKSRALTTTISGSRIEDLGTAPTSYSIDLADGGTGLITGNVIEKGAASPNRYIVHFGGEGTYPGSGLTLSGNTVINDRPDGATALYNQTKDSTGANIPAILDSNMLYGIAAPNLFQDNFGPPLDIATNNTFGTNPPALDTSSLFAAAVPEPGPATPWIPAILAAIAARVRTRRAAG